MLLTVVLALLISLPAFSQTDQIPFNDASNETSSLWFVELNSPPTADGTSLNTVRNEKNAFRKAAAAAGLKYKERYAFDVLWNGLSISVAPSQISTLARIPGVKNIYPVNTYKLDDLVSPDNPDINNAVTMTGADIVQSQLGFSGKGIKVAVMDTGLDYMHPDLGGCTTWGSCTRVTKGYDLVGDAYNADPTSPHYSPTPVPDPDPMDCNGHGSHVAGIIGANGDPSVNYHVRGVAPEVTFFAYRVFGCEGSTTDDVMVAAMERVLADGAQVLNMSIGSAYQWPQYPTAQASDRLVNKGVSVVASIGNNGANGLYSAGAPGVGKKVIGVASFDNVKLTLPYFTTSTDPSLKFGYFTSDSPVPPTSGTYPMARTGTSTTANDACNPLSAGSLTGKVALIRRGTCSFYQKSFNAQQAGAVGVVLYNNALGYLTPTVAGSPAITIPVIFISQADGGTIDSQIAAGSVNMTWTSELVVVPNPTAGLISSFSSYGLAPDLSFKPDIGAPGGYIRSTYFSRDHNGYAVLSGTSMASPHTAGGVALLLQARPNTPSSTIRDILQNSAVPKNWFGNPGLGFLDNVNRQGAGMLQIDKAILSTTKIEPGKLALGESQFGPVTSALTVTNKGDHEITYDLSFVNALSVGGNTFTPSFFLSDANVTFSVPSITIPSGGTASVNVTITAPTTTTTPNRGQYGGYIVFTPQGGGESFRVPYAGLVGDYQSIIALAPTTNGFPWLAKVSGTNLVKQTGVATYTLANGDVPYFLLHLDHQVAALRVQIVDANTGKDWHYAYLETFWGRNGTATGFFALPWDGSTFAGGKTYTAPNGQYQAVLSVLKALGDPNNPADWETWSSPTIILARP